MYMQHSMGEDNNSVQNNNYKGIQGHAVNDLKFIGPLEIKFVAPMPKQTETTSKHFLHDLTCDIENCHFGPLRPNFGDGKF